MKLLITIAVAVTALWFGSLTRAAAPPDRSEHPTAFDAVLAAASSDGSYITNPANNAFALLAFTDAMQAIRWKREISAVLLALCACAYLPRKYRSWGAHIRYLVERFREAINSRWRRWTWMTRVSCRQFFDQLFGRQIAINSAIDSPQIEISDLPPRERAIAVNILRAFGVSEHEDVVINAADGNFIPGRVTEYERGAFMSVPTIATNASQFSGNNPHEFLSQYAVRYVDPNLSTLDDFTDLLAPPVMSNNSRFVEYAIYNFIDAFLSMDNTADDIRAIGADFATLRNTSKQLVTQRMNERGLAVEVDEAEELLDPATWQQDKIAWVIGIGARTRFRRAVALLVAIATAASKTWTVGAAADPDQDLMDELDNLPIRPTDIVFGQGAWAKRSRTFRGQATAGAFAGARTAGLAPGVAGNALAASRDTAEDLAGILGVDSVRVSRHRKATGASTIGDIIGSLVLLFVSSPNPSRFDYTNLKTFRAPALGPNGQVLGKRAVYVRQVGDKRWRLAVSFGSELVAVTSSIGAEVITVS